MHFKILIAIAVILFSASCKEEEPEYRVEPEFEPYINDFVTEAAKRGKEYNFQTSGLIMEWGDNNDEGWAGLCHYEDPIRIEIDENYWQKIQGYPNTHRQIEEVIFHELAHGFVHSRGHRNDLLSNGEWASLMAGADIEDYDNLTRSFNINYRGFRKDYYLDELFIPTTSAPAWSNYSPNDSQLDNLQIIQEDNYDTGETEWPLGNLIYGHTNLERGIFNYYNTTSQGSYFITNFLNKPTIDHYIKFRIKHTPNLTDNGVTIIFGGNDISDSYFLTINNDGHLFIGDMKEYSWYVELTDVGLIPRDFNTYEIKYFDEMYHFYINSKFVYHTDHEGIRGGGIGFVGIANSTTSIEEFEVRADQLLVKSDNKRETKTGIVRRLLDEKLIP